MRRLLPIVVADGRAKKRLQAEIARLRRLMKHQSPQSGIFELDVLSAHQEQSIMLTDAIISAASELEAGENVVDVQITPEQVVVLTRSEERRVGQECVSTCRSRW